MMNNPFKPMLEKNPAVILDGGLATELAARGADLSSALWSARLLLDDPEMIAAVHRDYLMAGAQCIVTATYQATSQGFMSLGLTEEEAWALVDKAVSLALSARDSYWLTETGGIKPLVAASVGPYGAYLADGSEYTGAYDLDEAGLQAFHRPRWQRLLKSGADLLACETIPSMDEVSALIPLIAESDIPCWVSVSCRDGSRMHDGTPIERLAECLNELPQVVAVGINCSAPSHITSLLGNLAATLADDKLMLVYPNSGENWNAAGKCWEGAAEPHSFSASATEWHEAGARLIGGCCRTTPEFIESLSRTLIQGHSC
jgi:homocysteine S-methyltransferase